jgi:hypothetical protein
LLKEENKELKGILEQNKSRNSLNGLRKYNSDYSIWTERERELSPSKIKESYMSSLSFRPLQDKNVSKDF